MKAPPPSNEALRLEALRQYRILDTPREDVFDDLSLLAAELCRAPFACVSFIDEKRQWFKSTVGFTITETSRDIAFCAHAILQPDLLVVPDVLADARFAGHPMVTAEPKLRFYAGVPLVTPTGHALGTLCVLARGAAQALAARPTGERGVRARTCESHAREASRGASLRCLDELG